jgi:hypothetical protein
MISKNSSSPASQSCCTSSPPKNHSQLQVFFLISMSMTHPFQGEYHNRQEDWRAVGRGTIEVQLRSKGSTCLPLQEEEEEKPVKIEIRLETVHCIASKPHLCRNFTPRRFDKKRLLVKKKL